MSVVVHSMDRDVGCLSRVVTSPSLLLSSLVWALPLAVGAYLALVAYLKCGFIGFSALAVPASAIVGYLMARMGSTATTPNGFLWSVFGSAAVFCVALSVAVLPAGLATHFCRDRSDHNELAARRP